MATFLPMGRTIALAAGALTLGSTLAMAAPVKPSPAKASAAKIVARKPVPAPPATATQQASANIALSKGRGQLVTLSEPIKDVMISNPEVADVQVRSPRQIYIFGKASGESTIFAVTASGKTVYSANLRVTSNVSSVGDMLNLAMPDAQITTTAMNGVLLLTGTVSTPEESAEAERLAKALVGTDVEVVNRTKTATPVQVNLQVRIAEVSRQVVKTLGVNLLSRDTTGGFMFGIAQGRTFGSITPRDVSGLPTADASSLFGLPADSITLPFDPAVGRFVTQPGTAYNMGALGRGSGNTNIGLAGKLLGLDLASAIDLAENEGLATTLAQPNLTALSGETASFLAGGEIPIPLSTTLGQVSVEFKQYGVSLAFTPTVLSDGRISMRVRPEVSQLTNAGAVQLNGYQIPALSTRRVETTVELGSGQSFMIGGLLQNTNSNTIDRAPGLGNLPILGALFRSTEFRKNETELVIIVTPYLVTPVSAGQIKLPTDGVMNPTELERFLLGKSMSGKSGAKRPVPRLGSPVTVPASAVLEGATPPSKPDPAPSKGGSAALPAPGFGK